MVRLIKEKQMEGKNRAVQEFEDLRKDLAKSDFYDKERVKITKLKMKFYDKFGDRITITYDPKSDLFTMVDSDGPCVAVKNVKDYYGYLFE